MSDETLYFVNLLSHDNESRAHTLFCALFDKTNQRVDGFDAVVCLSSENTESPEYASFKDIINKIQKLKFETEIARSSTQLLIESFKKSFESESYMIELMHYLEHNETEKLQNLFKDNLTDAIGGVSHPTIKIRHREVTREEADNPGKPPEENQETEEPVDDSADMPTETASENDFKFPDGATVARFEYVLSPVSGTRIDELKSGDKIMIKIKRDDSGSRNVINLLMLEDEENKTIRAIPAEVESLNYTSLGYQTTVKITDGIFATNIEDEPTVKAKLAGNATLASVLKKQESSNTQSALEQEPSGSKINIFILIGLVIALIWIAAYFLLLAE